jgi:subtilase family serine protease
VFVATGGDGSTYNGTGNSHSVNELATNPNAVAVGGTQFIPNTDGTETENDVGFVLESAWNNGSPLGATAGGASAYFSKPSYQLGNGCRMMESAIYQTWR